MVWHC